MTSKSWRGEYMACYRYITPALHGRWRTTLQEALAEAVRAGQARGDPMRPDEIEFLGGARIEAHEEENGGNADED